MTGGEAAVIAGAVGAGSAIVAAAIATFGTYRVTQRSIAADSERWYASQVHLANVTRADRLREIYGRMAQSAVALRLITSQRGFILEGETQHERDERHEKQITEAIGRVGEFGEQILIESSAEPVRSAYELVVNVTIQYMRIEANEPAGPERMVKLNALSESVLAMTDKVIEQARAHLLSLETPAPVSALGDRSG